MDVKPERRLAAKRAESDEAVSKFSRLDKRTDERTDADAISNTPTRPNGRDPRRVVGFSIVPKRIVPGQAADRRANNGHERDA